MICQIAVAMAFMPAAAWAQASAGQASVFASERIMGRWVPSYFSSLPDGSVELNECEALISDALTSAGFSLPSSTFSEDQRRAAKKLRPVLGRYPDLSSLPNDTAVAAADAVMPGAGLAVVCGVKAAYRKGRRGSPSGLCADARCKAVDTRTRRRVATGVGQSCDFGSSQATASISAIREACRQAGATLVTGLSGGRRAE